MDTRACQAFHEEICDQALRHYEKLAKECCWWNSVVPKAIEYYKINKKEILISKEKERTYEFDMDCDNCGGGGTVKIPFGTTIDAFKASYDGICPDCGCPMKDKKRWKK